MKLIKFKFKNFPVGIFIATIVSIATIWLLLNFFTPKIPIFGFHSIIDIENPSEKRLQGSPLPEIDYTKQDLSEFLDYLVRHNFWFLSTQDLYDYFIVKSKQIPSEHLGQRPIMISFDDSYKTFYTNLLPVLRDLENKYNKKVKVVLFINPGILAKGESKTAYNITCQNLRKGLLKGFYDIQSHGHRHKKLTELNTDELIYEIAEAQVKLRRCTQDLDPNKTVASHIAYPYGASNKKVEEYVSKYYLSGYLYNSRMLKLGWLRSNYQIPRMSVNHEKSPQRLIQMAERALTIKN
ncbi:polysaccharide deacetylase family protein [Aerosakkonema sp. BLCC-F183]|uniref:polysaccharide deacetylase family protein n=1 Tax=Aerosakkonema sp. BLCC-F183 TaxID=3342834 RepID=UPI0035B9795E